MSLLPIVHDHGEHHQIAQSQLFALVNGGWAAKLVRPAGKGWQVHITGYRGFNDVVPENPVHEKIAQEVADAVDCARRGEPHPRLGNLFDRTIDEMERRSTLRKQVVRGGIMPPMREPVEHKEEDSGYMQTGSQGAGGATKSD